MDLMKILINDESGQGLVEYALIVGLIALVCVIAITGAGAKVKTLFENITAKVPS